MQAKEKANEARMFSENQKLGNNVRFAPLLNTRLREWFGYSLYRLKRKNKRYCESVLKRVLACKKPLDCLIWPTLHRRIYLLKT